MTHIWVALAQQSFADVKGTSPASLVVGTGSRYNTAYAARVKWVYTRDGTSCPDPFAQKNCIGIDSVRARIKVPKVHDVR